MKNAPIMALMLGLLIAMMPSALAFLPLEKLPAYGQPKKESVVKGGKPQYWTARADVQYRPSYYGTKYGGSSLRKGIQYQRSAPGYRASVQKGLKAEQGESAVKSVESMSGKPGESTSKQS